MNDIHILHLHWRHLYFFSMFVFRPILNVFSRLMWHRDLIWSFSERITRWLSTIYCSSTIFSPSSLCLHSVQVCWSVCLLLGQHQILISKSFIFLPDQVSAPPFLALYSFFILFFFSFILFLKVRWLYCTFTFSHTHFRISLSKFHENPVGILRGISLKGEMTSLGYLFFPSVN